MEEKHKLPCIEVKAELFQNLADINSWSQLNQAPHLNESGFRPGTTTGEFHGEILSGLSCSEAEKLNRTGRSEQVGVFDWLIRSNPLGNTALHC